MLINKRDLPWRKTRDPYKKLLSELMLQQTQVDRVIGFYHKFLEQFPDFQSVAEAKEEEIIEYWGGLGYYNRARNLQKTAQIIVNDYHNEFPTEKEKILALPGLGEYTVGAVMSFALNIRAPIVDTNVARFLHRILGIYDPLPSNPARHRRLIAQATNLVSLKKTKEFNLAILDLCTKICTFKNPICPECPIIKYCEYGKR